MEIIDNTALKFSLRKDLAERVLANIPKSQRHPDGDLMVYWGQEECQWLTHIIDTDQPDKNLPSIPSPILKDYKWPGLFPPFEHQKDTASYLSIRHRAFCFNEAGTGKTAAAIWACDYLMTLGVIKRVLVICPLSIMYTAWQADVFKTAMHRSVAVAYGDRGRREKIIGGLSEFTVINYDGVAVVSDLIQASQYDLIIIDEANAYKNTSTKRWKTLAKLVTPSTRLWMMTGTPASQSPIDAFGLAKLVSPYRVPKFAGSWKDKVMQQVSRFKWIPKRDHVNTVFNALQPAIRYKKSECLDLPDLVYEIREVPLTDQAATYYNRLKKQLLIEAAGENISAVNAAAALSKLLQISGGAVYTDKHDVVEFDVSHRLQVLQEVLDECAHKLIVFVPYHHTITVVSEHLTKHGITNAVISGDVSAKQRATIIDSFQREVDPRVLVIQPQAASHGVTLTAADTIVFWSPTLSVETFLQCVGRIDRVGQLHKMLVVQLQGSEVERRVYEMLNSKIENHGNLVDLYKQVMEQT